MKYTVISLCGMYGEWGVLVTWIHQFHKKNLQQPNTKQYYISCVGIFLGTIVDWWVKGFGYMYSNMITDSTNLCCNGTCMKDYSS